MTVGSVFPESPADQVGLRPGDRIVAVDGQKLDSLRPFYESIIVGQKDTIELTVQDARSSGGVRQLRLALRGGKPSPMRMTQLQHVLDLPMGYFPLGFLFVGLTVLLLRPDDPNAWLLALFCGSFIAGGPLFEGAISVLCLVIIPSAFEINKIKIQSGITFPPCSTSLGSGSEPFCAFFVPTAA
jgi:hypothetical protein